MPERDSTTPVESQRYVGSVAQRSQIPPMPSTTASHIDFEAMCSGKIVSVGRDRSVKTLCMITTPLSPCHLVAADAERENALVQKLELLQFQRQRSAEQIIVSVVTVAAPA